MNRLLEIKARYDNPMYRDYANDCLWLIEQLELTRKALELACLDDLKNDKGFESVVFDNTNSEYSEPYVRLEDYKKLYEQLELTRKALELACNAAAEDGAFTDNETEYWIELAQKECQTTNSNV